MPVLLNRPDTAAGIKPVHEARQVPALVQAHADGQAAVEVGLADDVPAAPGEMLLVSLSVASTPDSLGSSGRYAIRWSFATPQGYEHKRASSL